jgi:Ca2+-transporting ATPase
MDMYKQILFQSTDQIIVLLVFHFLGEQIPSKNMEPLIGTLVFNTFVFAQIFISIHCRRLDKKLNIFEGLGSSPYFVIITLIGA